MSEVTSYCILVLDMKHVRVKVFFNWFKMQDSEVSKFHQLFILYFYNYKLYKQNNFKYTLSRITDMHVHVVLMKPVRQRRLLGVDKLNCKPNIF